MKPAAVLAFAAVAGGLPTAGVGTDPQARAGHRLAAFSRGCFWGMEARFRAIPGVVATAAGYMGGTEANPTYESIHARPKNAPGTGHVETVLVEYDPARVAYDRLLDVFAASHPGARSVAWTYDDAQLAAARARFPEKTRPAQTFWRAEDRHQQYDERNGIACPI